MFGQFSIRESKKKIPLRKPRKKFEDDIKNNLKELRTRSDMSSI
jgi:hypothetical protein